MSIDYSNRSKIDDIKLVRERTGCGLKEAKDAIERSDVDNVKQAIYKVLVEMGKVPSNIFWMVYVDGQRGPTFKHETYKDACEEAKRLCKLNVGSKVFVLASQKCFEAQLDIKESF